MKLGYLSVLIATVLLFFYACKDKNEETDYNPNVNASREFIYAEDILFEMINVYFKGITDTTVLGSYYAYLDNCAISYFPMENRMMFDYGGINRWCADNKFRRGRFTAFFDGPMFTVGSKVTFQMDSLHVDDELVEASMNSEFLGMNGDGKHQLSFIADEGKINLIDTVNEQIIHFDADYMLTWEEGQQTPTVHEDDMLLVTGTASGLSLDQVEYDLTIQEPLNDYLDCFWINSGTHRISVPTAQVTEGTIDYITSDGCLYKVDLYFGDSYFYENLKY